MHRYLYAYANPTAYVDPTGRVGLLTDLRDRLNQADEILREWATESDSSVGLAAYSFGRAIVGIGSAGPRIVNLASDAIAQAIPGRTFESASAQGSAEFGRTVDTGVYVAAHPINTANAIHSAAVKTTVGVMEGDRGASSDTINFFGQLIVGLKTGPGLSKELMQAAKQSTVAKLVSRGKASIASEGANGAPDLRLYDKDVGNELENSLSNSETNNDSLAHTGSNGSYGRSTVINPSGRRDNCSACVAATIKKKLERRTPDDRKRPA